MFSQQLLNLAAEVIGTAKARKTKIATAESCTGGLIAGCLTAVSGSSDVVEHGFVTYSNEAKNEFLNVGNDLLEKHGAVSEPVVRAMAEGTLANSRVDLTVAVTGIAGPSGGTEEKPVGLVHIASSMSNSGTLHERHVFDGNREDVREQTVEAALKMLLRQLED